MSPTTFARPRSVVTKLILICLILGLLIDLISAQDHDQADKQSARVDEEIPKGFKDTTSRPNATTDKPQGSDVNTTVTTGSATTSKPTSAPVLEISTPKPELSTTTTTTTATTPKPTVGPTKRKKFKSPLFQEIDPRQEWPWTINTVENPEDKRLWLIFKQKYNVDAFYRQMNIFEVDVEKYVRTIWARRIQMLKAKYKCTDHWEQPFELSLSTIMTIVDNCDNDKYMCANQPKVIWRKQYDLFLRSRSRKKHLVAHGQNGYNVYTLKKTIFILQRMRNFYNRCLEQAELPLDDRFDGPLEGGDLD